MPSAISRHIFTVWNALPIDNQSDEQRQENEWPEQAPVRKGSEQRIREGLVGAANDVLQAAALHAAHEQNRAHKQQ